MIDSTKERSLFYSSLVTLIYNYSYLSEEIRVNLENEQVIKKDNINIYVNAFSDETTSVERKLREVK